MGTSTLGVEGLLDEAATSTQRPGAITQFLRHGDIEKVDLFEQLVKSYVRRCNRGEGFGVSRFCELVNGECGLRVTQNTMRIWLRGSRGLER